MFRWIDRSHTAARKHADSEVVCPKCYFTFWPVAGLGPAELATFRMSPQCPQCGHAFAREQSLQVEDDENTFGPFERPVDSRIQVSETNGTRLYKVPGHRKTWWGLHYLIIYANFVVSGWIGCVLLLADWPLGWDVWRYLFAPVLILMAILPTLLIYLRTVYTTHELWLGPKTLRLRRSYIFQWNYELRVSDIDGVRRILVMDGDTEAGRTYGIAVTAGWRRIKFPCPVSEADQKWLTWEIREFLHQHGAPLALPVQPRLSQGTGGAAPDENLRQGESGARPGARIGRSMENGTLTYRFPRGRCEITFFCIALCILFMPTLFVVSFLTADPPPSGKVLLAGSPFILVFGGLGIWMFYSELIKGFATHELVLGPDTTRLRRKLIFVKESKVPTRDITSVGSYNISTDKGKTTAGIEIAAGNRTLSVKTKLSVDERRWLTEDIIDFAREHGAKVRA